LRTNAKKQNTNRSTNNQTVDKTVSAEISDQKFDRQFEKLEPENFPEKSDRIQIEPALFFTSENWIAAHTEKNNREIKSAPS
jgi:hypothetical protein